MTGNYNSVNLVLAKISREIAKYFSIGKRKLMYFGPLSNKKNYDIRQEAFKSVALYHGLKYDQIHTTMDVINSYTEAYKFFNRNNSTEQLSIFCANDNVAIGVLRACNELNISVPKQVEIIGINNIPASEFTEPPLSTVSIPSEFMGEYAIRVLLDKIEHNIKIPINHVVSTELIERETTMNKD
ncbi:MAG: substrate-binding domain-containing protein [Erysipelotrichaceae bacterium]